MQTEIRMAPVRMIPELEPVQRSSYQLHEVEKLPTT